MPWIETEPMNKKVKFISAYLNNEEATFLELCERFNISGKTGYKYINQNRMKRQQDGLLICKNSC